CYTVTHEIESSRSFDLTGIEVFSPAENVAARRPKRRCRGKNLQEQRPCSRREFPDVFIELLRPRKAAASPLRGLHQGQQGGDAHRGAESGGRAWRGSIERRRSSVARTSPGAAGKE